LALTGSEPADAVREPAAAVRGSDEPDGADAAAELPALVAGWVATPVGSSPMAVLSRPGEAVGPPTAASVAPAPWLGAPMASVPGVS
jgi:hypothetical protein